MQLWTLLFLHFSTPVLVFGFDLGRIAKNRNKSAPNKNLPLLIKNVLSIPPHVRLKDDLNSEEIVLHSTVIYKIRVNNIIYIFQLYKT